jgi:hypothetical protein
LLCGVGEDGPWTPYRGLATALLRGVCGKLTAMIKEPHHCYVVSEKTGRGPLTEDWLQLYSEKCVVSYQELITEPHHCYAVPGVDGRWTPYKG